MKKAVAICFLVLFTLAVFPIGSSAKDTEKTVDPYEYTQAYTLFDALYYIKKGKTKDGREFTAKYITFSITPTLSRGEDEKYQISTPPSFTIDCAAGSRAEIPFIISETVIRDDDWGFDSFAFNGKIVILTTPTQDWEPAAFSFKAYYVGNFIWKGRFGPPDRETVTTTKSYTEEKPYNVTFFYIRSALALGDTISPDEKQGYAELTVRSEGTSSMMLVIYLSSITLVEKDAAAVDVTKDTDADKSKGETDISVLAVIVVGALGVGAAAMGAAGSAGSDPDDKGSSYSMVICKDFGDKIKYNAGTVYVNAKMVETTAGGGKIERPDLTDKITVFSGNPGLLEVSENILSGGYMSAGVIAGRAAGENTYEKAAISFRFAGKGGVFQNNVMFNVVGKEYISLDSEKLFVLGASGRSFNLPFELVGFMQPVESVTVKPMSADPPFTLSYELTGEGNTGIISAADTTASPLTDRFFDSFSCEITAQNSLEFSRTVFEVVICYEGILPDFLGRENQIIAYKNDKDEIPPTNIAVKVALWDENKKALVVQRPGEGVVAEFSDKAGVSGLLGLSHEFDRENSTDSYLLCVFKVERAFPGDKPAEGRLVLKYDTDGKLFESETPVSLMPDVLEYSKVWQEEYDNCVKIINTYLPPGFRSKKLIQLKNSSDVMGIADLQLYRGNCWKLASRLILQEKESYILDESWYDEAIATAELLDYIGGIALDVALGPFAGPISGFFISHAKSALLELIDARITNGSISFGDLYDILVKRLVDTLGQADNLIEVPPAKKVMALSCWLATYVVYRIIYRWIFDEEDDGRRKGLYAAIENGLLDFAGKGISILLADFVKGVADKRGLTKGSTADSEQEYINDRVREAAKKGLAIADELAPAIDKKIDELIAAISDFANQIINKVM